MWGNDKKGELPDELKDLGLTPAQIKEAIQAKKDLETKLATTATELSTVKTDLQKATGLFNETKTRLDELEASSRKPPKKEEKVYTSFIDDEDKAFTERAVDAMQPVAATALRAAANSAKLSAKFSLQGQFVTTPGGKISLSRLWEKWVAEIDKAASEVNLATLGNEATWINIFDYVKGKHFNELMAEPQTFVESVQSNQDKLPGQGNKEPEKLNDSESEVITKMSRYGKGVTPEVYQKMKSTIKTVSV